MVSEPYFVLGIKQTSLASKEDSHMHITIRSHTFVCWTPRHLATTMALCCVKIQQPSNPCLSLSDMCTSSLRLMIPTRQRCSTAYRNQNPRTQKATKAARATTHGQRLLELSHTPSNILDSKLGYQPHTLPRRPCRSPIHLAWESRNHTTSHAPTRIAWLSVSSPRTGT